MQAVDLKILLEAGSHFGHKTNKWNPKASAFIYKAVGDTHIIDLAKTKEGLEKAAKAVLDIAKTGGTIVFVGTKRQAAPIIKEIAAAAGVPYFSVRWIGGFITNWDEVRKNSEKLEKLRKDLKDQNALTEFTKYERTMMEKEMVKLETIYGGVTSVARRPQALFIVDVRKEIAAIREADQYKMTTIGVVDTNADPSSVTFPIPANDDAVGSITYIVKYIADAYKEGRAIYDKAMATPAVMPEVAKETKKEVKPSSAKASENPKQVKKVEKPVEKKAVKEAAKTK
jgi:small subunit ribosomal protein S2